MASIDPELQHYYEVYFDLFASVGWQQLIEELEQSIETIDSVGAIKDVDDMYYRKGQLNILNHLINFESLIKNSFDELDQEPEYV